MKLTLNISNTENINPTDPQIKKYEEICAALISSGALDGVKLGQAVIHFNRDAVFMGIELRYWPWKRKSI